MELMDTDEERGRLLRQTAKHREALEGEVRMITESTEKIIKNALIIGGSLALAYFLVRQFSGSVKTTKSKERKVKIVQAESPGMVVQQEESHEPGLMGQIGAAIATQASVFLLNLAKEKLMEYLQSVQEKKDDE
ncbi:MAG TPA: hypothetical protein VKZ68_03655 [Ohtaekwangia sp.]|nr:hypothetical protein [Ohtaekwangia sp.]